MMESYGFLLAWQTYEDGPDSIATNLDASGTLKPPTHQGTLKQLSVLMAALSLLEGMTGKPAQAYRATVTTRATEALANKAFATPDLTSRDRPMVAPEATAPKVVGVDRAVPQPETVTPPASDDGTVAPATTAAAPEPAVTTLPREPTLSIQSRPEQPTVASDRVVQTTNAVPSTGEAIDDQPSAVGSNQTQKTEVSSWSLTSTAALASTHRSPSEALSAVETATDRSAASLFPSPAAKPAATPAPLHLAQAQIVPDATLPVNSQVAPGNCSTCSVITGGTERGVNLYHSFQRFSIPTGGEAYFNNAAPIQNILTRVTGSSISNIDGLIRANGIANLYLLNPSGIVFGPNARLNIGGSFVATTATSFKLPDGSEYGAINPQTAPLLTINLTPGLQYGVQQPGTITSQGILATTVGQNLTLAGGDVNIIGGRLYAPGGQIKIGGVAETGVIALDANSDLRFPRGMRRSNVIIDGEVGIDVTATGGGSINVSAQNIHIRGTATNYPDPPSPIISAGITEGQGFLGAQAGDITLDASGRIIIENADIKNKVNQNGIGNAGNINIIGKSVSVESRGFSFLDTTTQGDGNAGNISIQASDRIELTNSILTSRVDIKEPGFVPAKGNAGRIVIKTPILSINRGGLDTSTFGRGNGGDINIESNDISFNADTRIESAVGATIGLPGAEGDAGRINITTGSLSLTNRSQLNTGVFGRGNGGDINIKASGAVIFDRSDAFSEVQSGLQSLQGNGGNIYISAHSLALINGSQLFTLTRSRGDAGNVTIKVGDSIVIDGIGLATGGFTLNSTRPGPSIIESQSGNLFRSGIFASVEPAFSLPLKSEGGNVDITANSFSLTNGARIITSTSGLGNAGSIRINAATNVRVDGALKIDLRGTSAEGQPGSIISSSAEPLSTGNAGDLTIKAGRLVILSNGQVVSNTSSTGQAGNIDVTAGQGVLVAGSTGGLFAQTNSSGKAGNITLNAPQITLQQDSQISTTATATSTNSEGGGSINLNASSLYLAGTVGVFAETQGQTPAGTLILKPYEGQSNLDITLTPQSKISASTSGTGNGGNLIVTAPQAIIIAGPGKLTVETTGKGDAGNIVVTTQQLTLTNGVQLLATTSSSGKGGNIVIDPLQVSITNGARVAVSGTGTGADAGAAGDLTIDAGTLTLDLNASLNATSFSGQGGNIVLHIGKYLLLRHNSLISTSAGENNLGTADGGNIAVNAKFIVAAPLENSDITANAFGGSGGKVTINATRLFWLQPLSRTDLARLDPKLNPQKLFTNDITAVSRENPTLNGVVTVNTLDLDPSQGLGELNLIPIDSSSLIAQSCATGKRVVLNENKFVETGRSGLPASPEDVFRNASVLTELGTPTTTEALASTPTPVTPTPRRIVEAQALIIDANGKARLVAQTSDVAPTPFQSPRNTCPQAVSP